MQVDSGPGGRQKLRALSTRVSRRLDELNPPEWATVMGTALLVGIGAGLGVVVLDWMIAQAQYLFFQIGANGLSSIGILVIVVMPVIGGLIIGPIIYFTAREAKGHGVPEVMEAVALKGGRIRPRVVVVKSVVSAICIGSGGSAGSEGPIVQIGSGLGSFVGQVLHLSDERTITLVACGAGGAIGAIFNAPIAGALFGLEVILGDLRSTYFGAVVISSVMADVVVHIFMGSERVFTVPSYALISPVELILYAALGLLAALVSVAFTDLLLRLEDLFDDMKRLPEYIKPALGGLILGVIGLVTLIASTNVGGADGLTLAYGDPAHLIPSFYGVGYEVVSVALLGNMTLGVGLVLLILKLVATSLTLGSGGSGGTFAPALFMGAMLGVAFGQAVNTLFPGITAPAGAYALVGMAAVLAGAAHAPATSILLLFELTRDYNIILPLMLATVICTVIARTIQPQSSYTIKLARRGIHLQQGRDVDLMEGISISEAMEPNYESVTPDMPVTELAAEFERTHHHGFPVVTKEGVLVGVVTVSDLKRALDENHNFDQRKVKDIATVEDTMVAYPDESLATAMLRLGVRGVGRLPVVSRDQPPRFIGMLRRENIIRAYNQAMTRRTNISHRLRTLQRQGTENLNVLEIKVEDGMSCEGRTLRELAKELPENCIVASIRRRGRILIPHGNTVIQSGDQLTVLATPEHTAKAREVLC